MRQMSMWGSIIGMYITIQAVPGVPNPNAVPTNPHDRPSSSPFISGDTFRSFCTHIFDETNVVFYPTQVQRGDTVFVRGDVLDLYFSKYHGQIKNAYILITHNSDYSAPGSFADFLEDPKIIAWFVVNADCVHHKLYPIPIGLSNRNWPHGNISVVSQAMQNMPSLDTRNNKVYLNFRLWTNPKIRVPIWEYFKDQSFCFVAENRSQRNFLEDMKQCRFVISPPGNGFDCHRTWEALYMGCIPLVEHSSLDSLLVGLPVIFVDDWQEVDERFLNKKYEEIKNKKCNLELLWADYWYALIKNVQEKARVIT